MSAHRHPRHGHEARVHAAPSVAVQEPPPSAAVEAPPSADAASTEAAIQSAEQELLLGTPAGPADPFTAAFLRAMGADVLRTLDARQRAALDHAISSCRPFQHHAVHLRSTISLVFVRFYVVLLAGRDRRSQTVGVEHDRRQKANRLVDLVASVVVLAALLVVVAFVLYELKCALGIDLMEGKHARDLLDD